MFEIQPHPIQKEEISSLLFPLTPIEHSPEKRNHLMKALLKAMEMGNSLKKKIKIVFYDSEEIREVETTVWNSTTNEVVLKNGVTIPFHRVVDVKYN